MPERFNPNPFDAAAERDREEEKKFWENEIKEWQERQTDKTRKDRMSVKEIRKDIYNNIHGWLPARAKGSFVGTKRDPNSLAVYGKADPVELVEFEQLIRDVDEYIKKNGLENFTKAYATHFADKANAIMKAFEKGKFDNIVWEKRLTDGEIDEEMEDLYRAMRKKGYSRKILAS